MALITTTRPNREGQVTVMVTGTKKSATEKILQNYLQRTALKVSRVLHDERPKALRQSVFLHGISL